MWSAHELIVAPATVAGAGARAIVRIAGDGTEALLRRIFVPMGVELPRPGESPRVVPGRLADEGLGRDWGELPVDVLFWPGPGGPIGGPLAEVQLPASAPLVDAVIAEACRLGARLARGGEFTLRGFLTGRLDLVQAEAVLAVVDARTPEDLSAALDRMAGGAGRALNHVRGELLDLLADIEASIDFADEATPDAVPATPAWRTVAARLDGCRRSLDEVARSLVGRDATAADVPRVVLVGRPNIGKSSLFNALVGRDAALVADESGTTRDWIEARVSGDLGREWLLVDLAGLDASAACEDDLIASAAQARARAEAARADVIITCRDTGGGEVSIVVGSTPRIDVLTRCDRFADGNHDAGAIPTSASTGVGIATLRAAIDQAVEGLPAASSATLRMRVAVEASATSVAEARRAVEGAVGGHAVDESIISGSVRTAVESLGEVTGAAIGTDLLDRIFSRHCIGK